MTTAAMIDLETLSTKLNTVILTLGAVKFDPYSKEEPSDPLYMRIDVDEQLESGRIVDDGALKFWEDQDPEVREEAIGLEDRISVADALGQFHKWVLHSDTVWANGSVFDIMILENWYAQNEKFHPWEHWRIRDVRTVFNMGVAHGMDNDNLHNALADAYQQALGVQNVFSALEIRPPWEDKK
jgi:hypothetical protein